MRNIRFWIWGVGLLIVLALIGAQMFMRDRTPATPEAMTQALRESALKVSPADLELTLPEEPVTAYGVIVDLGLEEGESTLVAFSTGDASLYFHFGGGMIGGGSDTNVTNAAMAMVEAAQPFAAKLPPATRTDVPLKGQVRVTLLTNKGLRSEVGEARDMVDNSHRLAPVFYAANAVVTALRRSGPGSQNSRPKTEEKRT